MQLRVWGTTMTQWGRGGVGLVNAEAVSGGGRYGQRSVWLALIAFAIGITSLVLWINVPKDVPEQWRDITTFIFMVAFLSVAPLVHAVGFVFALIAVFRAGERRGLGVLGLLLNSVSVLFGVGFLYFAAVALGSFT